MKWKEQFLKPILSEEVRLTDRLFVFEEG